MKTWYLRKIFQQIGKDLRDGPLPWHVRIGLDLYAPSEHCKLSDELELKAEIEGQDYRVTVKVHTRDILWTDDLQLYYRVLSRVFDQLFGSMRF